MNWESLIYAMLLPTAFVVGYFAGRRKGWQAGVLQAYLALTYPESDRYAEARELMLEANRRRPLGRLEL